MVLQRKPRNTKTTKPHAHHGVAFVINKKHKNYINAIYPFNDRLMSITFGSATNISFVSAYAPTAPTADQKEIFYKQLEIIEKRLGKQGPTLNKNHISLAITLLTNKRPNPALSKW